MPGDTEKKKLQYQPRQYQLDLLEYVVRRNGIIYLPTGSGKTYVALLALKRFSHLMEKTIPEGGKRAIFMCNTIELSRQQYNEVKKFTNLKVGFYVGERNVDSWDRKRWNEEIAENQVLVGTSQIFLDLLTHSYLKVTDLSVVIIDECHHATKSHPMHEFLGLVLKADPQNVPRVIGLTGVLIKGNKLNNINLELSNLEAAFRGNIVTVSSMEQYHNVMVHSTKPLEKLVTFSSMKSQFDLEDKIKYKLNECYKVVDDWDLGNIPIKLSKGLASIREPNKKNFIKNLLKDFVYQMEDFGLYAATIAIMSPIIEFEIKRRQSETLALRNLYRYVIATCESIRHLLVRQMKAAMGTNDDDDDMDNYASSRVIKNEDCHSLDVIYSFATPKLRSLLQFVKDEFTGKDPKDICALIFVERRYTAKCLYYVIEKFVKLTPELKNVLSPEFMVGRKSLQPAIESILDKKWTLSAIERFRSGESNLIICSSVLEEGIDIQACNYVFALDRLKTFSSYIQTKGRARSHKGLYAVFCPKVDEEKAVMQIRNYQKSHDAIKKFLIGRILNEEEPCDELVAKQFVDVIPPFQTPSGAILLASSALALIHRYCQMLPSDAFGCVLPWFTKVDNVGKGFVVTVKLPLQSTVRETILSDPMESAKLAKISAAFKACVRLYQNGELNEKLLPISKTECVSKVSEELFPHWNKHKDEEANKQTGKRKRRIYERLYPEELCGAMPVVGEPCYAYAINIIPNFEINQYTEHICEALKTPSNYAILTRKPLPLLAEMPLFMNQGPLKVKISDRPIECLIDNGEKLKQLQNHHTMIFRDILQRWENFFVMDTRNKENSYLIVPLLNNEINWQLVLQFQRLAPQRSYSLTERQRAIYRPEDFVGKIINKWYSDGTDDRFIVTKVRTDLTPMSPFENGSYASYVEFFETQYSDRVERVVQRDQFLLEVRELTSRRNFFVNAANKTTNAKLKRMNAIILLPEMCHNFMYPGDLWIKALFLPSILHRLHFMLHAERLRRSINQFLGIDNMEINSTLYNPKPLTIDPSLRRAVDSEGNATLKFEEPKKLLPHLPPKTDKPEFEVRNLMVEEATWKEYLEPQDYSHNEDRIYPVELLYYHKFISGLTTEMNSLVSTDESEYKNTQFELPAVRRAPSAEQHPNSWVSSVVPCIKGLPLNEQRRVEILERSAGNINITPMEQCELLAAITTAAANDVFDMERFELLGDSFLKFSISLYLANKFPTWHEGYLTELKSKFVSNRNLLYCMLNLDIPNRICAKLFYPNTEWLPPLISLPSNLLALLQQQLPEQAEIFPTDLYELQLTECEIKSGQCYDEKIDVFRARLARNADLNTANIDSDYDNMSNGLICRESIYDKTIADTLEAILGVCVKNYGIHRAFQMLEYFGICKSEPNMPLANLLNLTLESKRLRTNISPREVDGLLINHEKLEKNLGYKFRDRAYLLQAMTHPSFPTNRLTGCYQELEFIGDAILDFVVSCYIFERNREMTPGKLTDLRSALVNNITLGCVCVRHRFHLFLLAENSILAESIKNFDDFQATQNYSVSDQVRILMEENECIGESSFNISVNVDVPKALGDIVEALIAAVYLDSRDLLTTWNVVHKLLERELHEFSIAVPMDPVRQLFEHKTADAKFSDPVLDNDVSMVKCTFNCMDRIKEVNGFGSNSKQAKKAAAKYALKILSKCS